MCDSCWPDDPQRAWDAALTVVSRDVEESHHSVTRMRCACGQQYVQIFCERIDWRGGNDPMDWVRVPVSDREPIEVRALSARKHLVRWFSAEDASPTVKFVDGLVSVPPHD